MNIYNKILGNKDGKYTINWDIRSKNDSELLMFNGKK